MWRPNTLYEVLGTAEDPGLEQRNGRFVCPNCRTIRPAVCIVDTRALPIVENWSCDACWTGWQRQGRNVDGLPAPLTDRRGWLVRWVQAHGAPAEVVAKIATTRQPDPYKPPRRGGPPS